MYHARKMLMAFILSLGIPLLAQEVIWDGFFDMSSQAEAEQTSLDSKDTLALKKAGVYYFSVSHGSRGIKIIKKNRIKNALKAVKYLEKAYKLDRRNVVFRTWAGTANLALAGVSKKLTHKIKYSNRGISHFNAVYKETKDNLNYLAMRTISFTPVPKSFKNLTKRVLESGSRYLEIHEANKDSFDSDQLGMTESLKQAMLVCMAYTENLLKNEQEARRLFSQVNEQLLLSGNSEDSSVWNNFQTLKKKL